jgi:hypothetical protein
VQYSPSEQGAPAGRFVFVQPVAGLQPSTVHSLPSSQSSDVPGLHEPDAQVSTPLQGLLSLHCAFELHVQLVIGGPVH